MKTSKQITVGIFTVIMLAAASLAKANGSHNGKNLYGGTRDKGHDLNTDNKNKQGGSQPGDDSSAPTPPVDSNVGLLIIAGTAIGAKIITDKIREVKA